MVNESVSNEVLKSTAVVEMQRDDFAVVVEAGCKSYSKTVPVLSDFSMNVPAGTIYSLLGASGCGKTTILSCIIGSQTLDSGNVYVFGERPGSSGSGIPGRCVGYMPQGVTLYGLLTIKETFQYFGRLFGMTATEILGRIEFLVNFLDLPSPSQQVATLSGGQQRRVSLGVCFLHEPSLLILDEPTVGVDPLMRESIWNHLCDIVRMKHTTVIITTHYIEEARRSDTVGLMRNGRLMMEKSPDVLSREFNTNLLEDVVIKLCLKDEKKQRGCEDVKQFDMQPYAYNNKSFEFLNKSNNTKDVLSDKDNKVIGLKFTERLGDFDEEPIKTYKTKRKFQSVNNSQKIFALFIRNMLLLSRNPRSLYMSFLAPTIHLVIMNFTFGPEPKLQPVGIVNPEIGMDWSMCSGQLSSCNADHLSCLYLNFLSESAMTPIMMRDEATAIENVHNGNTIGFISFPHNFTANIKQRYLASRFAMDQEIVGSTVSLRLDMTNVFKGRVFQKALYQSFQEFARKLLKACEFNQHLAELPITFNAIYGKLEGNYQDFICPAVLIVVTHIIPLATASYALIVDRNVGTLERSMVAGATVSQILISVIMTEGILIVIQTIISYTIVTLIFGWTVMGSNIVFFMCLATTAFAGMSIGLLLVQFILQIHDLIFVSICYFSFNLHYGGTIWPSEGALPAGRVVSRFLPCTWGITSVQSILTRGWSITHPSVWNGFAAMTITAVLCWILTVKNFKPRL